MPAEREFHRAYKERRCRQDTQGTHGILLKRENADMGTHLQRRQGLLLALCMAHESHTTDIPTGNRSGQVLQMFTEYMTKISLYSNTVYTQPLLNKKKPGAPGWLNL